MRILVVEDNDRVASFILKGLREEGYAVDHAPRGDEATRMARITPYDLLVLDLMLPGTDGLTVLKGLRALGNDVPVIILTARDALNDRVAGLDAGADDYLTKPFAFSELLARIRAILRRRSGAGAPALQVANLTVDPDTRRVMRGDATIALTAREFSLLEFLLRNRGRVLTRSAIIDHVWDMNFDSDTNLVDVHIRHLRRKVDEGFEPKLIHTVRGVGYVLREEP